jgi:hypothetical protein
MKRYSLSIETNENSIDINSFDTKKEALKQASYFRTGGLSWRNELTAAENPHVSLFDTKKEVTVYQKPLFKYALKK